MSRAGPMMAASACLHGFEKKLEYLLAHQYTYY
jgi:hypothetical protein